MFIMRVLEVHLPSRIAWGLPMRKSSIHLHKRGGAKVEKFGHEFRGNYGVKGQAIVNAKHSDIAVLLFQVSEGGVHGE